MIFFCLPAHGAEPIDGFRDLKFGMTPTGIHALPNCRTPHDCIYELSNKNRYLTLSYSPRARPPGNESTENLLLSKITIDMGYFTEEWYQQIQMMLGKNYRLTNDFSNDMLNAFLEKKIQQLQAGYEDGQVILQIVRRKFGNMILKVVYQNTFLAKEFKQPVLDPS